MAENRAPDSYEEGKMCPRNHGDVTIQRMKQDSVDDSFLSTPPDGGLRAWSVCFAAALCNGIIFSIINCYGILYVKLLERLKDNGVENPEAKGSLVGSLAMGSIFFISWISGILADRLGIRVTSVFGACLATTGMLISSFVVDQIEFMYASFGLMYGIGSSLIYTPSLVILGHYFKKRLGVVNGIVTCGSSVVSTALPPALSALLETVGLDNTLRVQAGMLALLIPCCMLFKPRSISETPSPERSGRGPPCCPSMTSMNKVFNKDIWKNRRYIIWVICIPLSLFGYFVPFVHLPEYVKIKFADSDGKWLLLSLSLTSGIARLVTGFIMDNFKVNPIVLQQLSFLFIGALTMAIPSVPVFGGLVAIAFVMGFFDGTFISVFGPIAFQLCGEKGASQAIGNLLALCSIPMMVGPPVAGLIHERTKNYVVPFVLAGVPPIVGAILLNIVYCNLGSSSSYIVPVSDTQSTLAVTDRLDEQQLDAGESLLLSPEDAENDVEAKLRRSRLTLEEEQKP